jgi:DNA-binding Xre family transcriptional regulator
VLIAEQVICARVGRCNGHALRFSTLTAICDAIGCTPGELLGLQDP